jgi:putative tricarboxylic transport membrane protein
MPRSLAPSLARLSRRTLLATALASGLVLAAPAGAEVNGLELVAPAAAGGGWDQHARAMQDVLEELKLASGVQVTNIPGAGGTIGLAQFVSTKSRKARMLVVGQVLQGAVLVNHSPVSLEQVTPIARLTGEYGAVVVPVASPIATLSDLIQKLKAEPGSVSWGGGSIGSTDHTLVGLIAKAAGVDPSAVNYIATAGGSELTPMVLGGHVTVGVAGLNELAGQIGDGKLRVLGVSSAERLPGFADAPTLKEQGFDVQVVNWRGLMAPAGINEADRQALEEMIAAMVASETWKAALRERGGWTDLYLPADQFAEFLQQDRLQVEAVLRDIGLVQ